MSRTARHVIARRVIARHVRAHHVTARNVIALKAAAKQPSVAISQDSSADIRLQ